jgi:hypothetical protein
MTQLKESLRDIYTYYAKPAPSMNSIATQYTVMEYMIIDAVLENIGARDGGSQCTIEDVVIALPACVDLYLNEYNNYDVALDIARRNKLSNTVQYLQAYKYYTSVLNMYYDRARPRRKMPKLTIKDTAVLIEYYTIVEQTLNNDPRLKHVLDALGKAGIVTKEELEEASIATSGVSFKFGIIKRKPKRTKKRLTYLTLGSSKKKIRKN